MIEDSERIKEYIMEGLNFEYKIPDLPDGSFNIIRSKKISNKGFPLSPDDRVRLAQTSVEIAQVLAYSVYRKYKIFLDRKENNHILRMFKG